MHESLGLDRPRPGGRFARSFDYVNQCARSADGQLVLAALTIWLIFGVLLLAALPLWAGKPVPAPTSAASPAEPIGWAGLALAVGFGLVLSAPFRPYRHALSIVSKATPRLVVVLTILSAVVALLAYPRFGSDVFEYLGFERMWVVYGDNPLLATPANHPTDWSTALVWFTTQPPAYGPLWAIVTWPIVRLAGDSPLLAVLGYKALSFAAYAAACWLIAASVPPERRRRAVLLFAWSPLVLFEALCKVHNDILIAAGMLAAVYLVGRGHGRSAQPASLLAVTATGLVKATALVVAPLLAVELWCTAGLRRALLGVATAVTLAIALYAPFWMGAATLQPLLAQTNRLVWSPGTLCILLVNGVSGARLDGLIRAALALVWLAIVVRVAARLATRRTDEHDDLRGHHHNQHQHGQHQNETQHQHGQDQNETQRQYGQYQKHQQQPQNDNEQQHGQHQTHQNHHQNENEHQHGEYQHQHQHQNENENQNENQSQHGQYQTHQRHQKRQEELEHQREHQPQRQRRAAFGRAELAGSACIVLLSSQLLLSTAVFAHYFVPAVALAAISGNARLERLVLWLSIGSLAAYAVELVQAAVGPAWIGSAAYQLVGSMLLLGPALAAGRCAAAPPEGTRERAAEPLQNAATAAAGPATTMATMTGTATASRGSARNGTSGCRR